MQKKNNRSAGPADGEGEADEVRCPENILSVFKMSEGCLELLTRKRTNCENTDLSACPSQHVYLHVCEQAVRRYAAC